MRSPPLVDVHLFRMDLPEHACPWGLRAIRLLQEQHIPFEDHRLVSQAEVDAFKVEHGVATTPQLFAGSERIGGYTDLAARLGVRPVSAEVSYTGAYQERSPLGVLLSAPLQSYSGWKFTGCGIGC